MMIDSIRSLPGKRSKKVCICLSDGTSFCLYEKECRRLGFSEGDEVAPGVYEDMVQEIFIPRAKRRAMHLLEKQDRTRANLSQKLREAGYPSEAVEAAISYVESYHYIDDARYARNYIRYHQSQKSRRKLSMDLAEKGIKKEIIDAALEEEYTSSEEDLICALLTKRHYDATDATQKDKSRMYRYLCSRGFSSEQVLKYL